MNTITTDHDVFLRRVNEAMLTLDGADLAASIARTHDEILKAEREVHLGKVAEAKDTASQMAASASLQWHLSAPLLEMLQHTARRRGEMSARAGHRGMLLAEIAKLCQGAEVNGGMIAARRVREILAREQESATSWAPSMLSFVASQAYRLGYFQTGDTAVVRALPFVGYAMWEESPDKIPQQETAFLHEGTVMARPQIQAAFGLVLQHLE